MDEEVKCLLFVQRIADSQAMQPTPGRPTSSPGVLTSQLPGTFTPAAQAIDKALLSATPAANLACSGAKGASPGSARYVFHSVSDRTLPHT